MNELVAVKHMDVRFSEVDSMKIVWHGNYVKYFEDAREEFGAKYDLGYLDMYANGFYAPLVKMNIEYKSPMIFGDEFDVEIRYVPCEAAKLLFEYTIRKSSTGEVCAVGTSMQVFIGLDYKLILYAPDFVVEWRKAHGVQMTG